MKLRDETKIESIFKATLALVKVKGLAGITISEIAKKASLATGTVYLYFQSKEQLINNLYTSCRKASVDTYFENFDRSLPFKKGFKIIWLNLLNYRIQNFEEAIFLEQCYHSPFISESAKEMTRQLFQPLYHLMERGKKEKQIKELDSFLLLAFMVGSINVVVRHSHYSNKKLTKDTIEELFSLCWDGIKN
jgi:TetR/AcrR family transcriptional regulator, repressor of fatR-cypB operon